MRCKFVRENLIVTDLESLWHNSYIRFSLLQMHAISLTLDGKTQPRSQYMQSSVCGHSSRQGGGFEGLRMWSY